MHIHKSKSLLACVSQIHTAKLTSFLPRLLIVGLFIQGSLSTAKSYPRGPDLVQTSNGLERVQYWN